MSKCGYPTNAKSAVLLTSISLAALLPTPAPLFPADSRYHLRRVVLPAVLVLPLAYEPYLYLLPQHVALQHAPGEALFFYLEDHQLNQTVGQWQLTVVDQQAYSPWQAPFGGVQLAPGVPEAAVRAFVLAVQQQLLEQGVRHVQVRTYPTSYDEAASHLLRSVFEELGYRIARIETNNTLPLTQAFEEGLHPSARRRLRKCHRHGLRVEQETPLFLPLAYEFMKQCRQEKGQALSLPLERLQMLFRTFPNDYFLFSVRDATGVWAAMTVLIRVSDQVLYNFYPASPLAWNTFSPVILLTQGLHAFGQASGYRLLDLGTSTLPEGPNESLLVEQQLSTTPSPRLILEW